MHQSVLLGRVLFNNFHHLLLDLLLFKSKSILVPNKVWLLWVDVIFLHAAFEQTDNVPVVRVLCEGEASAVVHKLFELVWLVLA
jgi:hypothetical protein|tara:strand:- start:925 stop:1176 length:252 start_codon:yes stop_codon:yes gene_type:complete